MLAGALLDFRLKFGRSIPAATKIIQLDMENTLIGQNRSPDVAVVGNLGTVFEAMLQLMKDESIRLDFTTWRDELRAREGRSRRPSRGQLNSDESPQRWTNWSGTAGCQLTTGGIRSSRELSARSSSGTW
ncbi:MAG: hypothetical protein IH876_07460 [Gemmatimonadetes bacterium]|nr:hypothetical protein [Gemmatimonadota bacterium]